MEVDYDYDDDDHHDDDDDDYDPYDCDKCRKMVSI